MERVLVVDDERACRHALADALAAKGFEPDTAENGRLALRQLEKTPSGYGFLYTDIRMPEVGGLELAEQVAGLDPTIATVLLTGFTTSSNALAALRAGAVDLLPKPYTLSELEVSLARASRRRKILLGRDEYHTNLQRLLEVHELQDFTNYATQCFRPDTFGIFVREGRSLKELSFFDRYGRSFEPDETLNERSFRFPLEHESFSGHIYLGYDTDDVPPFQKEKHIFDLFRDRIGSYLRERYMAQQHRDEMRKMFVSSIQAHARSIEAKDVYTAGHCDRVDRYAELLARHHGGFDERWIFNLKVASILHDIGKIGVRGAILCKPASLDKNETEEIRTHPVVGGRIVRTLCGSNLEPAVRHHHERFDGKGYPSRLKGENIPLESRIILIADTFDAMTSNRPYRRAIPTECALEELGKHAGTQFDPELVKVMVDAGREVEAARHEMENKATGDYFEMG